ncbi:hypothetical protein [Salipiger mangrovisoli]|uniref:Uncharacterized protein n=1 Tax=Salipiger mangrovisoli TaxID=2865933 RepID=A0ABR9X028_9RHOB|nr:hypothetical protein [Salipiger mangrovisoli]MBE9636908.1 hypothetical protein [Salipiger mangrovisoli]
MQIVENWAYLIGVIMSVLPSPQMADFYEVHIRLEASEKVVDFPMLVQGAPGDEIVILARTGQISAPDAAAGKAFAARVRAAGPQPLTYYVAPDWRLGG